MPQAIKYETTTIEAVKTAGELVSLIVKYGGRRTSIEWDESGQPTGIAFEIEDRSARRLIPVRLTARTERVREKLEGARPYTHRSRGTRQQWAEKLQEQAHRIVWRHLKDLVEQQLLAVEIGQYDLAEVFLHGVVTDTGMTVGEAMARYSEIHGGDSMLRLAPGVS
jgi:hypothetical protein